MINWFDITVAVVLIASFISGIYKGFVMQVAGVAGLISAIMFGGKIAKHILPRLIEWFGMAPQTASIVSYIIAFVLIMAVAVFIGKFVEALVKSIQLGLINRICGGVIAILIVSVLLSLLLNLTTTIDTDEKIISPNIKKESITYGTMQNIAPTMILFLRENVWKQYLPNKKNENQSERETTIMV